MPAQGAISEKERWVITIEVDGDRDQKSADALAADLDKLVKKYKKPNKGASWTGKTRKKK